MIEFHLTDKSIEYAPEIIMDESENMFVITRSEIETIFIPVTSVVRIISNQAQDQ